MPDWARGVQQEKRSDQLSGEEFINALVVFVRHALRSNADRIVKVKFNRNAIFNQS